MYGGRLLSQRLMDITRGAPAEETAQPPLLLGGWQWRAELCLPVLLLCCLILSHSFPPQGLASVLSYPVLQLTATRPCSMRRYVTFDGSSPMCYDLSVRNYTTVSSAYGKAGPPIACQ